MASALGVEAGKGRRPSQLWSPVRSQCEGTGVMTSTLGAPVLFHRQFCFLFFLSPSNGSFFLIHLYLAIFFIVVENIFDIIVGNLATGHPPLTLSLLFTSLLA